MSLRNPKAIHSRRGSQKRSLPGVLSGLLVMLMLSACGGSGSSSGNDTPAEPGPSNPVIKSEGTPAAPVTVQVEKRRQGTIAGGTEGGASYYKFTADETGVFKIIVLADYQPDTFFITGYPDLAWTLYADAGFETGELVACDDFVFGVFFAEECTYSLTAGTVYYLEVRLWETSGTEYRLEIVHGVPTGGASEGSVGTPVEEDLVLGGQVSVAPGESSYVQFEIPRAGSWHLSSGPSGDVDHAWTLYADNGFTDEVKACDHYAGVNGEGCTFFAAAPATYYLKVDNHGDLSSNISIGVSDQWTVLLDEGTPADPIPLTLNTSRPSAVASLGTSYYQFVAPEDGEYAITIRDNFSVLYLGVFDDLAFDAPLRESYIVGDNLSLIEDLTGGTTYYLLVTDPLPSISFPERGEMFTLEVE